jgi:hypothetical protein
MGKILFVLTVVMLAGAGCATKTGEPVEYSKACSMDNDKKYIEVSGYLNDTGGVFCSNTGGGPVRCGFKVLDNPSSAQKGFSADIEQGTGANSVEKLGSGYKKEDIKIHDDNGAVLAPDQKVKIVGQMNYAKGGGDGSNDVCYLTVTKIEKQ